MTNSSGNGADAARSWAINGRFVTQRMTGVQRYAHEIVRALDDILAEGSGHARLPEMRLVMPPGVVVKPVLSRIGICETGFGSGHAWDQVILPLYGGARGLSLGNFGPISARNHIVCIHDANTFIQPESYSRMFGLAYRTLLPLIGRRASRVATVSRFSADMLVKYGVCRSEKIFIAPNGHEHALRWDATSAKIPLLAALKRPYVLLQGSRAKHKNVDTSSSRRRDLTMPASTLSLSARSRISSRRMRRRCCDPMSTRLAMLATTIWRLCMMVRYVWHSHTGPRGSEFRHWKRWASLGF